MDKEKYIETRVLGQIDWYDKKSVSKKRYYYAAELTGIFCAAAVPCLVGFLDGPLFLRIAIAVCGSISSIAGTLQSVFKFKEDWRRYRVTAELLQKELYLFQTGAGKYQKRPDDFPFFVERVEKITGEEISNWLEVIAADPE